MFKTMLYLLQIYNEKKIMNSLIYFSYRNILNANVYVQPFNSQSIPTKDGINTINGLCCATLIEKHLIK